jgi:hypothetical protein
MRSDRFHYSTAELDQLRAYGSAPSQLSEITFPEFSRISRAPERGRLGSRSGSREVEFEKFVLVITRKTMKRLHDRHFGRFGLAGSFVFDSLAENNGLLEHPEIRFMIEARINYLLGLAGKAVGGYETLVRKTSEGGRARLRAGRISIQSRWLVGWPSFIRKVEAQFQGIEKDDLRRTRLGRGGSRSRSVLEVTDPEILVLPTNWITLVVDAKKDTINGKPVIELGTIYPGEDIGPTTIDSNISRFISADVSDGDDGFVLFPWSQKGRDIIQPNLI